VSNTSEAKSGKAANKAAQTMDEAVKSATAQAEAMVGRFELPEAVRNLAERSIEQSRDAYGKLRDAAQQATALMEESTASATEATTEFNLKTVDYVEAHVEAGFDLARKLLETRDPAKAFELQLAFARKQTEAFNNHVKELGEFASKTMPAAGATFNAQLSKYFDQVRSSFPA